LSPSSTCSSVSGIQIIKYYLDVSKKEQKRRLRDRRRDPLKQWKTSPIDEVALKHWDAYTEARDRMFARTSTHLSPWVVVRADDKHLARLNVMRDFPTRLACPKTENISRFPTSMWCFPTTKHTSDRVCLQREPWINQRGKRK
jgi:hypothetical protein